MPFEKHHKYKFFETEWLTSHSVFLLVLYLALVKWRYIKMKRGWKMNWKNVSLTKENVDYYLKGLYDGTDGQYINLEVCFDKDDAYQMDLLRLALIQPQPISVLCKELLANHFSIKPSISLAQTHHLPPQPPVIQEHVVKEEVNPVAQHPTPTKQETQHPADYSLPPVTTTPVVIKTKKKKTKRTGGGAGLEALLRPNPDAIK